MLKELRDLGNTVVVVEHDEMMMRQADYIIDLGPGAGTAGGSEVFGGASLALVELRALHGLRARPPRRRGP